MRQLELNNINKYENYLRIPEIGRVNYYCTLCGDLFYSEIHYEPISTMYAYLKRHRDNCRKGHFKCFSNKNVIIIK